MYVGKFDWARCPKPEDTRDYVKEIIFNVISVHAEVDQVSPRNSAHVQQAMVRIVEAITEEVNRLFCVISRMNSNGCIQVRDTLISRYGTMGQKPTFYPEIPLILRFQKCEFCEK